MLIDFYKRIIVFGDREDDRLLAENLKAQFIDARWTYSQITEALSEGKKTNSSVR